MSQVCAICRNIAVRHSSMRNRRIRRPSSHPDDAAHNRMVQERKIHGKGSAPATQHDVIHSMIYLPAAMEFAADIR